MTKQKTDSEKIKSIDEKFTIMLVFNIIAFIFMLLFTMNIHLDSLNRDYYNNYKEVDVLKNDLQEEIDNLKAKNVEMELLINQTKNITAEVHKEDPIKINSNDVKEIKCLANSYLWNYDIQEYIPSEEYILTNCYEVLE